MPVKETKPARDEGGKPPRRPYAPPRLVEYGAVAKLTQNMNTGSIVLENEFL